MDLTPRQREVVATLVEAHRETDGPVPADEIAALLDRHEGTVHNHMQVLGTLGLVEGTTGPSGGYEPTAAGEAAVGGTEPAEGEATTLAHEYRRLDLTVEDVDLRAVHSPAVCRALVRFGSTASSLDPGDPVVLGPTPCGALVLAGEVLVYDDAESEVLIDVAVLEAPVEE